MKVKFDKPNRDPHNTIRHNLDTYDIGLPVDGRKVDTKGYFGGTTAVEAVYTSGYTPKQFTYHLGADQNGLYQLPAQELIERNPLLNRKPTAYKERLSTIVEEEISNMRGNKKPGKRNTRPRPFDGGRARRKPNKQRAAVARRNLEPSATMSYQTAAAAYGGSYRQYGDAQQTTRISKCEYIGDVRPTATTFALMTYNINPGDSLTCPWLSQIASSWEYYKVDSLSIVYKPNSGSDETGTIAIGIDFDLDDGPPVNKQELAEFRPYVSGVPWSTEIIYRTPRRYLNLHNEGKLLVRNHADPITNLTDIGRLYVMTQDVSVGFKGEIYIEYNIVLMNQQQADDPGDLAAMLYGTSNGDAPFDSAVVYNNPRNWLTQSTNKIFNIKTVGIWLVAISATPYTALTAINLVGANGATQTAPYVTLINGVNYAHRLFIVTVNSTSLASPATIAISITGNTGTACVTTLRMAPYSADLS